MKKWSSKGTEEFEKQGANRSKGTRKFENKARKFEARELIARQGIY